MARPLSASDSAIRKDLKVPEFIQRGKVLIVRRQFQEAVKVCRLGLLAHPTYIEGRLVLGMALMALSRHDEVLGEMRVALELAPDNPMAHLLKGEALYHKRDFEQSFEVLERAQELDPLNEKVRKLLDEIDDLVNYGGEVGPRAKTETKVYPAQQAHGVTYGDDPSDVLSYGGFSEWDSGVEEVDSTLPDSLASQLANDETEQIDEESDTDVDDPNLTAVGGDALSGVDPDLTALGGDALDMAVEDEVSEVGGRPISDHLYEDEAEEEDEYTTAPFLPPTHMGHNLPPLDGTDWSDSTITDDSPKTSAADQLPPDERTEEKVAGGYDLEDPGQMPAVILEDQTQEVEQADEVEVLEEVAGDPDWATPAPEPALDEGDLDDEEPTWVPGEHHEEPEPLGEIGAYDLSYLEHDEPTVIPGASAVGLDRSEPVGLEAMEPALEPKSLGEVYDEEDEEDDTVVNADAPPPEALFGDDDEQVEAPLEDQDFQPRAPNDPTKAVDLDRAIGNNAHDVVELTPSIPLPDQVVYASGVEEVSDESGTREIVSADPAPRADQMDPYDADVQIITPPPDPRPLPPIGAVPPEESGIEELASGDIILAEEEPDDVESDISEISVEMLLDSAGEMPPLPADDSSVFSLPEAQLEADPLVPSQDPAFDISTPAAEDLGAGPFEEAPYGADPPPDLGPFDAAAEPFAAEPFDAVPFDAEPFDAEPFAAEPFAAEPFDAGPFDAVPFDAEPMPHPPDGDGALEFSEPFDAQLPLPELGDSGEQATRVKFELGQDGYDPHDQLDQVQAGVVDSPDLVAPQQHATFAFEPGVPDVYPAGHNLPGPGFEDPPRPLMPEEQDEDELSLEPVDQSGEQDWQMPGPMRTAALDEDDGRAYPYDDPYPLDKPPTVETRPGGPLGIRGGGKPAEVVGRDGMLEQMTGESGLFRRQAGPQRREDDKLHRRRVSDGTATSWINILVGEPGSHRWIYLVGAALGVLALAVAVGLAVRYYRLGEQIQSKRSQARARLQAGNMRDFMSAAQSYADILARRSEDGEAHGMHARILAAIPFEFGDPLPGAEEQRAAADTGGGGADRAAADIYANLYGGSLERAAELVIQARKNYPESPVLPYLQGRVSLLEGNAAAASMQLETAHKLDPKDAVILRALGDSLAAQGMSKQALAAYNKALAINKDHIASLLGRARLRVATRQPPYNAQVDLTSITVGKRQKLATRGQKGWAYLVLARLVLSRAQMDQAKRHIRGAQAHKPARDPLFQDELAGVLIDASMLSDAATAIRKSKQLMKGRPHPFYHMARIHLLHGRPKIALAELTHAKGLQYAAANVLRARIYVELGRYADANKEVDRALGMAAGMLEAHIVKAKVLAAQKQGPAAESKIQALLREHPKDARLLTAYGEIYMQMGKMPEAREKFLSALKHDKHAYDALLELAEVHMAGGDFKNARKRLAEAHRTNPGNIMILSKLAAVEFDMGELAEAATYYNDALKRAPNNPGIRLKLAQVYTEQRRLSEAATQIGAAEARQPKEGELALAKGRLKLAEGKEAAAITLLLKATSKLPENAEAWDLLVRAYLMNNDESQASSTASTMAGRLEDYPEAEAALGRVVLNKGQSAQAVRKLNAAIRQLVQKPRPPRIKAMIHVLLGRAHQDGGGLSAAAGQYDEAARVCPLCPEPFYRKGLVQDERGETSAAIQSLRKALKRNKRFMEVYYDLGQVYEGAGQKAEAMKSYKTYLTYSPPKDLANAAREAIQNLQ